MALIFAPFRTQPSRKRQRPSSTYAVLCFVEFRTETVEILQALQVFFTIWIISVSCIAVIQEVPPQLNCCQPELLSIRDLWLSSFYMEVSPLEHLFTKHTRKTWDISAVHLSSTSMPSYFMQQFQPLSHSSQQRSLCFAMISSSGNFWKDVYWIALSGVLPLICHQEVPPKRMFPANLFNKSWMVL